MADLHKFVLNNAPVADLNGEYLEIYDPDYANIGGHFKKGGIGLVYTGTDWRFYNSGDDSYKLVTSFTDYPPSGTYISADPSYPGEATGVYMSPANLGSMDLTITFGEGQTPPTISPNPGPGYVSAVISPVIPLLYRGAWDAATA